MSKIYKNRIVAVRSATGSPVCDVRDKLINELEGAGLPYIHVGAGTNTAYAVIPEEFSSLVFEEIATSCDALVSGSGYLIAENFETEEVSPDWLERALANHPINYDIPIGYGSDRSLGLCGLCGGIGTHIGPPCKEKWK